MNNNWLGIEGKVVEGYRAASGTGKNSRYPAGSLCMQKPFFHQRGLDLSDFFEGTVNLDISPLQFSLAKPAFTFERVEWTHLHPPETFSFCHCRMLYEGVEYEGWVYTPHPETKAAHFQSPCTLEVITRFIPGLKYGDRVELQIHPDQICLRQAWA